MADSPRPIVELRRSLSEAKFLREQSQELRAEALIEKLALGFTYCKVAETAIQHERFDLALALIQRTQDIGIHAHRHLIKPNHVSESAAAELGETLKLLESRVLSIATQLK